MKQTQTLQQDIWITIYTTIKRRTVWRYQRGNQKP